MTGFYRWYAGVERPEEPERALAQRIRAMYGNRVAARRDARRDAGIGPAGWRSAST